MWSQESLSHMHGEQIGTSTLKAIWQQLVTLNTSQPEPAMVLLDGGAGHLHACGPQEADSSVCKSEKYTQVRINKTRQKVQD